jgi:hypothetical protein
LKTNKSLIVCALTKAVVVSESDQSAAALLL